MCVNVWEGMMECVCTCECVYKNGVCVNVCGGDWIVSGRIECVYVSMCMCWREWSV